MDGRFESGDVSKSTRMIESGDRNVPQSQPIRSFISEAIHTMRLLAFKLPLSLKSKVLSALPRHSLQ